MRRCNQNIILQYKGTRDRFNINMYYQCRYSHYKDKSASWQPYLHGGNPKPGKQQIQKQSWFLDMPEIITINILSSPAVFVTIVTQYYKNTGMAVNNHALCTT